MKYSSIFFTLPLSFTFFPLGKLSESLDLKWCQIMIADELAYFGESQIFHSTKNIHPAKQDTKYGCNPTPPLSTPITFNFCQLS